VPRAPRRRAPCEAPRTPGHGRWLAEPPAGLGGPPFLGPCITYLALKWSRQMRAAIGSWQACAPTVSHDGRRDFRRP
jgi:hypothetical protein